MARGNQREKAREKNLKQQAAQVRRDDIRLLFVFVLEYSEARSGPEAYAGK